MKLTKGNKSRAREKCKQRKKLAAGKTVASGNRKPLFESILRPILFRINCIEKTKVRKKRLGTAYLKRKQRKKCSKQKFGLSTDYGALLNLLLSPDLSSNLILLKDPDIRLNVGI